MPVVEDDDSCAPVFPRDLYLIADVDPSPALVVVDAWLDTVPMALSVRDPQQARQALHPWKEVAASTDAAVLLLCHTNRVTSANARGRYGATGELRKKARMTLYAQSDDEGRLLVGPEKMNTAAAIPASTFIITAVQHFDPVDDDDGTVPLLVYAGDSDRTACEHIADAHVSGGDEPGGNPAKAFVYNYLKEQGGEAPAAAVLRERRKAGFGEQELKDARRGHRNPRIASRKASFGEGWVWAIAHKCGARLEGGEGGTDADGPPTSPPSPPSRCPDPPPAPSPPSEPISSGPVSGMHRPPPGGVTASTPGMTTAVERALAAARQQGRFASDPPCIHCDKPVVGNQTDEQGRHAHIQCRQTER